MTAVAGSNEFVKAPWTMKPSGRSMFGHQADSRKSTLPQYTFNGSSTRESAGKVFLSSAHVENENKCRTGPGHIYQASGALGPQSDARKTTAPSYTFHSGPERLKEKPTDLPGPGAYPVTSALGNQVLSPQRSPAKVRFGGGSREQAQKVFLTPSHVEHVAKGTQGPPPGSYVVPGAIGTQQSSQRQSAPAFSMSRTDRLKNHYEELSKSLPGAGQYNTWSSIGKQSLSPAKTMPVHGFGSSTRDKEDRRFVTQAHAARTLKGRESPANYDHQLPANMTTFGKQTLGTRQSLPAYGFGSAARNTFKTSDTPGPGAYD